MMVFKLVLMMIIVFFAGYLIGWRINDYVARREREEAEECLRKATEFSRYADINLGKAKRFLEDAKNEQKETREMIEKFQEELRGAEQYEKADL